MKSTNGGPLWADLTVVLGGGISVTMTGGAPALDRGGIDFELLNVLGAAVGLAARSVVAASNSVRATWDGEGGHILVDCALGKPQYIAIEGPCVDGLARVCGVSRLPDVCWLRTVGRLLCGDVNQLGIVPVYGRRVSASIVGSSVLGGGNAEVVFDGLGQTDVRLRVMDRGGQGERWGISGPLFGVRRVVEWFENPYDGRGSATTIGRVGAGSGWPPPGIIPTGDGNPRPPQGRTT